MPETPDFIPPRKRAEPSRADSSMARLDRETQAEPTREGTGRRARTPLSAMQQKLPFKVPDGYVGRWVNDTPGRIAQLIERGYDFVDAEGVIFQRAGTNTESDRRVSTVVDQGTGMKAFAMVIPQDFYDEDRAFKQSKVDATVNAIKGGQMDKQVGDGKYSPEEIKRKGMVKIGENQDLDDE